MTLKNSVGNRIKTVFGVERRAAAKTKVHHHIEYFFKRRPDLMVCPSSIYLLDSGSRLISNDTLDGLQLEKYD